MKLLPCKCGQPAKCFQNSYGIWTVYCEGLACDNIVNGLSEYAAVEKWNKRMKIKKKVK